MRDNERLGIVGTGIDEEHNERGRVGEERRFEMPMLMVPRHGTTSHAHAHRHHASSTAVLHCRTDGAVAVPAQTNPVRANDGAVELVDIRDEATALARRYLGVADKSEWSERAVMKVK